MCKCVLQYVLGKSGVMLMLVIIFMAVTSAGSAEMMAVSSLFTYDIYKVNTLFCPKPSRTLFTSFKPLTEGLWQPPWLIPIWINLQLVSKISAHCWHV